MLIPSMYMHCGWNPEKFANGSQVWDHSWGVRVHNCPWENLETYPSETLDINNFLRGQSGKKFKFLRRHSEKNYISKSWKILGWVFQIFLIFRTPEAQGNILKNTDLVMIFDFNHCGLFDRRVNDLTINVYKGQGKGIHLLTTEQNFAVQGRIN